MYASLQCGRVRGSYRVSYRRVGPHGGRTGPRFYVYCTATTPSEIPLWFRSGWPGFRITEFLRISDQ